MATIATNLVDYADNGNTRTYAAPSHTVEKPSLVQQRRKVPASLTAVSESSIKVIQGTTDSAGQPIVSKYSFEGIFRGPVNGQVADRTASLALFREIVNSDEFGAAITGQLWIKD